jgi:hypothetical protein
VDVRLLRVGGLFVVGARDDRAVASGLHLDGSGALMASRFNDLSSPCAFIYGGRNG